MKKCLKFAAGFFAAVQLLTISAFADDSEDTTASYSSNVYFSTLLRDSLTSDQAVIYDALLEGVKDVAEGNRTDAKFLINTSTSYSGIDAFGADAEAAITTLRRDYPEYLFWSSNSWTTIHSSGKYYISLDIAGSYASSSNSSKVSSAKIAAAEAVLQNARDFAESCSDLPDYQKVYAYAEKICELNTYNSDAASAVSADQSYSQQYNDPWQMIYVFDNDSSTNVVCEGYAKAMKYLCKLSGIECYIVTSTQHMWNIVVLDGVSYHVDVTYADSFPLESVEEYHPYILQGAQQSSSSKVVMSISVPGYVTSTSSYTYEDDTKNYVASSILKVSTEDYTPSESDTSDDASADSSLPRGTLVSEFTLSGSSSAASATFDNSYAGNFANVYKIVDGEYVFVGCTKIQSESTVSLPVSGAGSYVIMLCEYSDLLGDADNDGAVTILDALMALKCALGSVECSNEEMADYDSDGNITVLDAQKILNRSIGGSN